MNLKRAAKRRRRGVVAVETAIVFVVLSSFIFAIFEFGRVLMDWSLLNNATREACRYALANNTSASVSADIQARVTQYMAGESSNFQNFTVTMTGTHESESATVNSLAPGDAITVTVSGEYRFLNIIPLASLPTNWTMKSSVTMLCEGGT